MDNDFDRLIRQLQENDVEHEVEDFWDENVKVIVLPYGESKSGLFLSLALFYESGNLAHIDLEAD